MGRPLPARLEAMQETAPVRPLLEVLVRQRLGPSARIAAVDVQTIERRVLRYAVRLEDGRTWSAVGKVYDDVADCGFGRWRRLWEEGFDPRDGTTSPRIPEPFAFVPPLGVMLMEEAPGIPLKTLVKKRRADAASLRAFGAALARLHGWPVRDRELFTVADHVARRCPPGPAAVAEAYPRLAGVIDGLVGTAARLDRTFLESDGASWTHGDCHLGQAHVADGELWLLDLDPMQPAHPAYDLAMVLTALGRLRTPKKAAYLAACRDEFLAAYFAVRPWSVAARLPVYRALILLKQACKRFRWQDEPGWERAVPELVQRAAACLDVLEHRPPPDSVEAVAALATRLGIDLRS